MIFDKLTIERHKMAAELELEGLKKLAEAQEMLSCTETGAAMKVVGDPMNAQPMNSETQSPEETTTLMLSGEAKTASLKILEKVASEMSTSSDPEILKLARQLDDVAERIEKTAYVYQYDYDDPEKEIKESFKGGVLSAPKGSKDDSFLQHFKEDHSHVVMEAVKKVLPFQKINKGK